MTENVQSKFEGWAIVEMMGHRREIGFVTTEYFGGPALFRVDTPGLPEREFILAKPEYCSGQWTPKGATVKRTELPARSVLVGPGSVYALNPCTEEAAREAIESMTSRPLILLKLPDVPAIPEHIDSEIDPDVDDDQDF